MKQKIEAVIFDADGTILDTRELFFSAFEHSLREHGHIPPPREYVSRNQGRLLHEYYQELIPDTDHEHIRETHKAFEVRNYSLVSAYEGVHDMMQALRKNNVKIGICTSRGSSVVALLERTDIKSFCDAIVHLDMLSKHKPDPEGVIRTLQMLQVLASRTAMIGDSPVDIMASRAAGLAMAIGITHGMGQKEDLENAGADYVVDHLSDILPLVIN